MPPLFVLILLIFAWSFAFWGLGSLVTERIFPDARQDAVLAFANALTGFALFVFYVLLLNFFLPLKAWYVLPLPVLGFVAGLSSLFKLNLKEISFLQFCVWGTVLLGVSIALAALGMAEPYNYDSGLYHFSSVRWANQEAMLPGLGLLHSRLAFNNSFFLYAAALNLSPWFNQARSLANNVLFFLLFALLSWMVFDALQDSLRSKTSLGKNHALLLYGALLAPMLHLFVSSDGFSSPTPDLASSLLQLSMFVLFYEWKQRDGKDRQVLGAVILVLATTMLSIKLSNAVFAGLIALWVLYTELRRSPDRRWLHWALALCTLFGLSWVWRGYLGSGLPLFPSTVGYIPFAWAMPKTEIHVTGQWVRHWAQAPGTSLFEAHEAWEWLGPWFARQSEDLTGFTYPLILSLGLALCLLLMKGFQKKSRMPKLDAWIPAIIVTAALIFWFFSAPDLRFAKACIYLLPISLALICAEACPKTIPDKIMLLLTAALLGLLSVNYLGYSLLYAKDLKFHPSSYAPIPVVELNEKVTFSGLRVYVPSSGDRCWDAPLPCTPYFQPQLKLLSPEDGGCGFRYLPDIGNLPAKQ